MKIIISKYLLNELKKYGLATKKIIAPSYGNAPNMSSKNLAVQVCISQFLDREIIYIPYPEER